MRDQTDEPLHGSELHGVHPAGALKFLAGSDSLGDLLQCTNPAEQQHHGGDAGFGASTLRSALPIGRRRPVSEPIGRGPQPIVDWTIADVR